MLVEGALAAENPPTSEQLPAALRRERIFSPHSQRLLSGPERQGGEEGGIGEKVKSAKSTFLL